MALLETTGGDRLRLAPVRFELAEVRATESSHGGDLLLVRMEAAVEGMTWSALAPAVEAGGLRELAGWAERLAGGSLEPGERWSSAANCLAFEAVRTGGETRTIAAEVGYEFCPPGRMSYHAFHFEIECAPAVLRRFAAELRAEAAPFAARARFDIPG